jgi:thiol-disulfide isomerase/thioredoxin
MLLLKAKRRSEKKMTVRKYTIFILLMVSISIYSAERMNLGELFTNDDCAPCAWDEQAVSALSAAYPDEFSAINYHVWYPGWDDPFYLANTSQINTIASYFGADTLWVPAFFLNSFISDPGESTYQAQRTAYSPLTINLSFNPLNDTVTATITVHEAISTGNNRIFFSLTENGLYHPTGSGGLSIYDNVFRENVPDCKRLSVNLSSLGSFTAKAPYKLFKGNRPKCLLYCRL